MVSPQFRPAIPADTSTCVEIRGRTRENAVSVERLAALGITVDSWTADVASHRLRGQVCIVNDQTVGYGFGNTHTGEVVVLAVLPSYEGRGIGKELLFRVVQTLQGLGHERVFLGCARDTTMRSHGFYRHLGWRPTGAVDAHNDEVLEFFPASVRHYSR